MKPLAILALLASTAAAQVEAVVTGPATAEAGDLIILDASQSSNAQEYRWLLVNSQKTFLAFENGRKCVFASGQAGEYIFVLVVAGLDNNEKLSVDSTEHRIVVGKPDPVVPVDPDRPDPPPTTKPTHVIVIQDQPNQPQAKTQILLQLRVSQVFANPPPTLLILNREQPEAQPYLKQKPSGDYPFYFAVADGVVVKKGGVEDAAQIEALVKE